MWIVYFFLDLITRPKSRKTRIKWCFSEHLIKSTQKFTKTKEDNYQNTKKISVLCIRCTVYLESPNGESLTIQLSTWACWTCWAMLVILCSMLRKNLLEKLINFHVSSLLVYFHISHFVPFRNWLLWFGIYNLRAFNDCFPVRNMIQSTWYFWNAYCSLSLRARLKTKLVFIFIFCTLSISLDLIREHQKLKYMNNILYGVYIRWINYLNL